MKKPTRSPLTSSYKKWFWEKSLQTFTIKRRKLRRCDMWALENLSFWRSLRLNLKQKRRGQLLKSQKLKHKTTIFLAPHSF